MSIRSRLVIAAGALTAIAAPAAAQNNQTARAASAFTVGNPEVTTNNSTSARTTSIQSVNVGGPEISTKTNTTASATATQNVNVGGPETSVSNINSTSNVVIVCKDTVTGKFSQNACSEKQLPFMGDRATRKLSIEDIGYIALGHIQEAEGNLARGVISSSDAQFIADYTRKEFERIAKSRHVEVPAWQMRNMTISAPTTAAGGPDVGAP